MRNTQTGRYVYRLKLGGCLLWAGLGACGGADAGHGPEGGTTSLPGTVSDPRVPAGDRRARHDICQDLGSTFGMGAGIFGDKGTRWFESVSKPPTSAVWTVGYMYAAADPHKDLEGFTWLVNFRLDTTEKAGASLPTVTFYRMLAVGREHGYSGSEAQVVQQMLGDATAVRAYLDDLIDVLKILSKRATPSLLHVEPDSWGFMMWAFDGVDGAMGNGDATRTPVSLSEAKHPALEGQSFPDHAGGLGRAMLYLRDSFAPEVRMGWHGSNFRVGAKPEVVTGFYSSMGAWDVMVTEPPHMRSMGSAAWVADEAKNQRNLVWLGHVRQSTGLPILIWQAYVESVDAYLGGWPQNQVNLRAFADRGVAGVLWDPNGVTGECAYGCPRADALRRYLSAYSRDPLKLPQGHPCASR